MLTMPCRFSAALFRAALCLLFALLSVLALAPAACAATLTVPSQYATIQAALTAAANGDTVLISDGTYTGPGNVDLDFGGKNVTVQSVNGPAKTIIDCGGSGAFGSGHRGFNLHSGETDAVISGLTIENGYQSNGNGGGIYNSGALTVTHCILKDNTAAQGGGIYNDGGTLTVSDCVLTGNAAENISSAAAGGGIYSNTGTLTLTYCTVVGNMSMGRAGYGSGAGGVFSVLAGGTVTLTNDILYGDTGSEIGTYYIGSYPEPGTGPGSVTVNFCDVQGGYDGAGKIDANPRFIGYANGTAYDLHLQDGSPCLGAGTPVDGLNTDPDGKPRGNPPTIGAYEGAAAPSSLHTHVLWHNANTGQTALWTVGPSGSPKAQVYGPFPGWTAQALADGPDGLAHILWANTDTSIGLWTVGADGTPAVLTFGPFPGWTVAALAAGSDNHVHLLWNHSPDSQMALWDIAPGAAPTSAAYGPYAGFTARFLAVSPDNHVHVLWNDSSGIILWDIAPGAAPLSDPYTPSAGDTAVALAAGPDNHVHVLWHSPDDQINLWDVDTGGNPTRSVYGPYPGYTPASLAVGLDNHVHVLWSYQTDGVALWDLAPGSGPLGAFYNSGGGWAAAAVSAGP